VIERFDEPVAFFLLILSVILYPMLLTDTPSRCRDHIGAQIGPNALGLIEADERIRFLPPLAFVYLMFGAGIRWTSISYAGGEGLVFRF
jgi:hypothetical protein